MASTLPIIAPLNDRLASRADCGGSSGEGGEGLHRTVVGLLVTSHTEAEVRQLSA